MQLHYRAYLCRQARSNLENRLANIQEHFKLTEAEVDALLSDLLQQRAWRHVKDERKEKEATAERAIRQMQQTGIEATST